MDNHLVMQCQEVGEVESFSEFMQYLGKDMKDELPSDLEGLGTCMATEVPSESSCWGALLRDDASYCRAGFVLGKGHFKNKVHASTPRPARALPSTAPAVPAAFTFMYVRACVRC